MKKKQKSKELEELKLYLSYEEHKTGGEVCSGDEDSDWPSYEDENIEWKPTKLSLDNPGFSETIKVDKIQDIYYLVVVRYITGGTFGSTNGAWKIIKLCETHKEALRLKEYIEYDDKIYKNKESWFEKVKLKDEREEKFPDIFQKVFYGEKTKGDSYNLIYKCWRGYFESLQDVEIHRMEVWK